MGKLTTFLVVFDGPNGNVFYAGQTLSGYVHVLLTDSSRVRGIKVLLVGRARVSWSSYNYRTERFHSYQSQEVYFNHIIHLFGGENDMTIPAGDHRFPFTFPLNARLPSSFEGKYGHVRYIAEAVIDRPWKFNHMSKAAFTVLNILNLNSQPRAMQGYSEFSKSHEQIRCFCINFGTVTINVGLSKLCYVPGETILVNATVINGLGRAVVIKKAVLIQDIEFQASGQQWQSSGLLKSKCASNVVAKVKKKQKVLGGETGHWENVPLVVPSLPPSGLIGCDIINITYILMVILDVPLKSVIKLIIGTVPLQHASHPEVAQRQALRHAIEPSAPAELYNINVEPGAIPLQEMSRPLLQIHSSETTLPPTYSDLDFLETLETPPPRYVECVQGPVSIKEEGDTDYNRGNLVWAPMYPVYTS